MSKFIKVTKIDSQYQQRVCGSGYVETRITILVNVDYIVTIEDYAIHFADFKIKVAESMEQIQEQIETNNNEL